MVSPANWWSQSNLDGMKAEFDGDLWASDDLLAASLEMKDDYHWQSHTMSHLARDNLGEDDCVMEDGGKPMCSGVWLCENCTGLHASMPVKLLCPLRCRAHGEDDSQ